LTDAAVYVHYAEQPFERSFLQRIGSRKTSDHRSEYDYRIHGPYLSPLTTAIGLPSENFSVAGGARLNFQASPPAFGFQREPGSEIASLEREG
jgi:hypothetical protein